MLEIRSFWVNFNQIYDDGTKSEVAKDDGAASVYLPNIWPFLVAVKARSLKITKIIKLRCRNWKKKDINTVEPLITYTLINEHLQ
jgi:hypothetical protein